MTLDEYLHRHFVSRQRFTEMAEISEQRLATLIELGAVPRATYVCDGDAIESAVFGASKLSRPQRASISAPNACAGWRSPSARLPVASATRCWLS